MDLYSSTFTEMFLPGRPGAGGPVRCLWMCSSTCVSRLYGSHDYGTNMCVLDLEEVKSSLGGIHGAQGFLAGLLRRSLHSWIRESPSSTDPSLYSINVVVYLAAALLVTGSLSRRVQGIGKDRDSTDRKGFMTGLSLVK